MKPDKPPEEELKPERIQDQDLEVARSFFADVVAALEWIETTARRLLSVFGHNDKASS